MLFFFILFVVVIWPIYYPLWRIAVGAIRIIVIGIIVVLILQDWGIIAYAGK